MSRFDQVMSVDKLIENDIHTPKDITGTNVENSGFISIQEALDAVEESRRLNHHKNAKEACAHEYEHRHFFKNPDGYSTCRCCAGKTWQMATDCIIQQYIQMLRVRKASCEYCGRIKDGCQTLSVLSLRSEDGGRQ